MKGKALRKHSLHEKTAASVLLKLFIRNPMTPLPSVMTGLKKIVQWGVDRERCSFMQVVD